MFSEFFVDSGFSFKIKVALCLFWVCSWHIHSGVVYLSDTSAVYPIRWPSDRHSFASPLSIGLNRYASPPKKETKRYSSFYVNFVNCLLYL